MIRRVEAAQFQWERSQTANSDVWQSVQEIVQQVRTEGGAAVRTLTAKFDGCQGALEGDWVLRVGEETLQEAWEQMPESLREALTAAAERIRRFHETQKPADIELGGSEGDTMGLTWRPLKRVGVYAPGGRAAYPSTVLMNVIPAQVAGVENVVLVSPPSRKSELPHPYVLGAAHLLGVREVYRIGGAQAVAALAYGTEEIDRVDKIVGPGNIYVALAKRAVMGDVGIDSIAGPSEVFVVADDSADPEWVAADMLAQAEHDTEAGAVCVTTSARVAEGVVSAVESQLSRLARENIAREAIDRWGAVVMARNLEEAFAVVNRSAPEHVELHMENAMAWLPTVQSAGAVFIGPSTPEPVGDYYAGPNHVLPTHGSARFASGLSVYDFLRRMTYVEYQPDTLRKHAAHILELANAEGLEAHAKSIQIRLGEASS